MSRRLSILVALVLLLSGCITERDHTDGAGAEAPPGAPAPVDWPPMDAAPVRPGAKLYDDRHGRLVQGDLPKMCSINFVFADTNGSTLYVGTASHCVTGLSVGSAIPVAEGAARGEVAYCSWGTIHGTTRCPDLTTAGTGADPNDFALIRIHTDDRHLVHPATFVIGGPTALGNTPPTGTLVHTYGGSDLRDGGAQQLPSVLDARTGVVSAADPWTIHATFDPSSLPGDSGSPVVDAEGRAVGVLQTLGTDSTCPTGRPDTNGIVSLHAALDHMARATGITLELQTWDLLDPPPDAPVPRIC